MTIHNSKLFGCTYVEKAMIALGSYPRSLLYADDVGAAGLGIKILPPASSMVLSPVCRARVSRVYTHLLPRTGPYDQATARYARN